MKLVRILFLLALAFLGFQCFRKKKPSPNLAGWLEMHFPGRFEIVDTWTEDPIRNLSFKKKRSVVADKTDSLLQIEIHWDKRDPDLGIPPPGEIEARFEAAKPVLADARELFGLLKNAGFEKTSASVRHGDAMVLIFENPSPENRKQVLKDLKNAISAWISAKNYGLAVNFMEPAGWQKEFGDIVPLAHWVRPDYWQLHNLVLSTGLSPGEVFDVRALEKKWDINGHSDRLSQWIEKARPLAEAFAKSKLKKEISILSQTITEPLDRKLGIGLKFPFSSAQNGEVSGYVKGDFLLDGEVFENLSIVYE